MLGDFRTALVATSFFSALLLGSAPCAAQSATLTGTYVDYVVVGRTGVMASSSAAVPCDFGGCSMRYTESGATHSCDTFFPGSPVESFTVVANSGSLSLHNGVFSGEMRTISGPEITGRQITWSGEGGGSRGEVVRLDTVWEYETEDRVVRVTMTVTNTGSDTLDEVYVMRNGDADFGTCGIGGSSSTDNDVVRQPPTDGDALLVAGAGDRGGAERYYVLGIGAHDDRARAHVGGFENREAAEEWAMPHDPNGATDDVGIDLIFREESLAPGASAIFEMFYVWGTSQAEVEARFDEVGSGSSPCDGIAEGGACTSRTGVSGVCHDARCCTGCWDGARCRTGTSPSGCGIGGVACIRCADVAFCESNTCEGGICAGSPCDDGETCTTDSCDEGADRCNHVVTSGCIVGGECVTEGDHHVAYPCLVCDSSRDSTDWSPVDAGESCGGDRCAMGRLFRGGTCDGMGECAAPAVSLCETLECEDPQTCAVSCVETGCPASERCEDSGRCVPILGSGATCAEDVECQSGMCLDGVCCGSPCDGTCVSCALPGHEGECSPIAAGTDPYEECNGRRVCDGAERCVLPGEDAGTDGGVNDASLGDGSIDAGVDASSASLQRADCNCSAAGAGSNRASLLGLSLVGLAWVLARRARR